MTTITQQLNLGIVTIRKSAWAPLGVFGIYVLGKALGAYRIISWLDVPTHILGGIAITYFFYTAIVEAQSIVGKTPLSIQVIFAFTSTGTAAVLWEFIEITLALLFGIRLNSSLERTLLDLFSGLVGGFIFSLSYWLLRVRRHEV